MPISKNGKQYYTKEQYRYARYETSALEYAQSRGYDLVKDGGYYYMRQHDSMIFTPRGSWFWNSRGLQGGALEFCIYYEGMTVTEAVLALTGDRELAVERPPVLPRTQEPEKINTQSTEFEPPEKSTDFRRLFAYLCKARGLSKEVVMGLLRDGLLYESVSRINGKEIHNAAFIYKDPTGKPVGAFLRGMNPDRPFKKDVPGSDKSYGWLMTDPEATGVLVFESAIDAASHATLYYGRGGVDRLSLEGLSQAPLDNYLKTCPHIQAVGLMLDNDGPGQAAAEKIQAALTRQGYGVTILPPPYGKDWNETLVAIRQDPELLRGMEGAERKDVIEEEPDIEMEVDM